LAMDIRTIMLLSTLGSAIHIKRPSINVFAAVRSGEVPASDGDIVADRAAADRELSSQIDQEIQSGFPLTKQRSEPLSSRVHSVQVLGRSDPCEADLLMNGLTYPYGLGARAMMFVDELQVAAHLNKSVAICDGNSQRQGIGWSRFFANPGFGVCDDLEACYAKSNSAGWLGSKMSKALRKESKDNAEMLTHMKQLLYQQLFTFNDETSRAVASTLRDAGLDDGLRYVGVHIRRGDKKASRGFDMSRYAIAVSEELEKRSLSVVFVASDDEHAGSELASELALQPAPTVIQLYSDASSSRTYDDSAGLLALLTDIAALRDAEVFVGTHLSYVGRLAYFLRGPEAASRSVSGDWLRGNMV